MKRLSLSLTLIGGFVVVGVIVATKVMNEESGSRSDSADLLPATIPIPPTVKTVSNLDLSEDLSEEVWSALHDLSRALADRDAARTRQCFTPSFRGPDFDRLEARSAAPAPAGIVCRHFVPGEAAPVDLDAFLAGLDHALADWRDIRFQEFRMDRADFDAGPPLWGRVRVEAEWSGTGTDGSVKNLLARGVLSVVRSGKNWFVNAFQLDQRVDCTRAKPMFTDLTDGSGVRFEDQPMERHQESWNGCACGDVDGDGLLDLFVPNERGNFLYLARAEGGFEDRAEAWGVRSPGGGTGTVLFDFDNDHDLDLVVADESWTERDGTRKGNPLRLYRNGHAQGEDRFEEVGLALGLAQQRYSFTLSVLDFDGDGFLDLFVGNYGHQTSERNNSWVDADNAQANQLFHNRGGERFEDVGPKAGLADTHWTYASAAADYDRDGDVDLYVVNDFGPNRLMVNHGDGTFGELDDPVLRDSGFGMSASWSDFDNDGSLDLYVSNMWSEIGERILARLALDTPAVERIRKFARGNSLILGRTEGGFSLAPVETGATQGRWAWASPPLDVDLDGRMDLFCTNGFISGTEPGDALTWYWRNVVASSIEADKEPAILVRQEVSDQRLNKNLRETVWKKNRSYAGRERDKLWLNCGREGFRDLSSLSGTDGIDDGRAAIAADFDGDGDVDLFVHNAQRSRHRLLRNDVGDPGTRFLAVELVATRGQYQAVGAEVQVVGPAGPCSLVVSIGSQYLSCQPTELCFGIGDLAEVPVRVLWPGRGWESFGPVKGGQRVRLVEGTGVAEPRPARTHSLER